MALHRAAGAGMKSRAITFAIGFLMAVAVSPLRAQEPDPQKTEACKTKLAQLGRPDDDNTCASLGDYIAARLQTGELELPIPDTLISPRDLQSTSGTGTGNAGSPAQSDAVPSVNPIAIAGGSISAVGTNAGTHAITTLSVNPIVAFFLDPASTTSADLLAKYSRFLDVSVFFPVSGINDDGDGDVDYYGIRLRLNLTGINAGHEVWKGAREAFSQIVRKASDFGNNLEAMLLGSADPAACADALLERDPATIENVCGAAMIMSAPTAEDYRALRRSLASVRDKADSKYLGLDLRGDFGDPTLGNVPDASGTFLFAGIAGGRRFKSGENGPTIGIRGRLGIRHARIDNPDATHFAVDGGFAFEMTRTYEGRQINVASGMEFRYGKETTMDDQFETNFLMFRFSLSIPVTAANSISISVGAPIAGGSHTSPTLSINADWGLLFPQLVGEGGR